MEDVFEGLTETETKVVVELASKGGREYSEVADAVGMSVRQLYRYRQRPYIRKAIRELVLREIEDDLPDITGMLRRKAKKGDFRSAELLTKMTGLLVERREVNQRTTIETNAYDNMSRNQIDEELKSLENELKGIQDARLH